MYLKLVCLIIIFSFIINIIFIFNKTIYTLITSVLVFLFVSIFLLFLDLEFIALSFSMIYIGGIAVMFLFLILIVDVKVENTKNIFFTNHNYLLLVGLTVFFSFFFSFVYIEFFDPFIFNDIFFQNAVLINNFFMRTNVIYFDFDVLTFYYISDINFSDLFILGFYLFRFCSFNILLIAIYLFIATIIAILLSANIFETNMK